MDNDNTPDSVAVPAEPDTYLCEFTDNAILWTRADWAIHGGVLHGRVAHRGHQFQVDVPKGFPLNEETR